MIEVQCNVLFSLVSGVELSARNERIWENTYIPGSATVRVSEEYMKLHSVRPDVSEWC